MHCRDEQVWAWKLLNLRLFQMLSCFAFYMTEVRKGEGTSHLFAATALPCACRKESERWGSGCPRQHLTEVPAVSFSVQS